jgi:hypothetical protein
MRSQEDRDTVTVAIFTTILFFALALAVGAVLMVLVAGFVGQGSVMNVLGYLVLACASGASILYLWRHRLP